MRRADSRGGQTQPGHSPRYLRRKGSLACRRSRSAVRPSQLISTSAALALSVRLNGLTLEEALVAGTVNAACALGIKDAGRLEAGCAADFLVLQSSDWRDLLYSLGANPVRDVWIAGKRVN